MRIPALFLPAISGTWALALAARELRHRSAERSRQSAESVKRHVHAPGFDVLVVPVSHARFAFYFDLFEPRFAAGLFEIQSYFFLIE